MKANETALFKLLQGQTLFIIPMFQRQYTWGKKEWSALLQDIKDTYSEGNDTQHFMGSIVTKVLDATPDDVSRFLVIDGQQRLTTLTVLLAALRDAFKITDSQLADKIHRLYLINEFANGENRYKVLPTQADRAIYYHIIDGKGASGQSLLQQAYNYFANELKAAESSSEAPNLKQLESAISRQLGIVSIVLSSEDDEYRIFESLNAKGARLTQADLIRNYFFMKIAGPQQEEVYNTIWRPMEQSLEEGEDDKPRGQNLEEFFRYEFIRTGDNVREGDVYQAWKRRLDKLSLDDLLAELKIISHHSQHYKRIIKPEVEEDKIVAAGLHWVNRWGAQTVYPFLLYLYQRRDDGKLNAKQFAAILQIIESFLVRRAIVGVPTNTLNKIFPVLPRQLPGDADPVEGVRMALSDRVRRWPSDAEFMQSLLSYPLYKDSRPEQRKVILERIEESYNNKEMPNLASFTIEHIMPQTLTPEWEAVLGGKAAAKEAHDNLLHTIGNLTLTRYNGELSNHPFSEMKRDVFAQSSLMMNKEIAQEGTWTATQITTRSQRLANRAIHIWPGPVR